MPLVTRGSSDECRVKNRALALVLCPSPSTPDTRHSSLSLLPRHGDAELLLMRPLRITEFGKTFTTPIWNPA